jgi:formylmethanofuran dehydrogenase subunit E
MPIHLELDDTDTIKCSRCEEKVPEAEIMQVHAWWVCGNCYDEL